MRTGGLRAEALSAGPFRNLEAKVNSRGSQAALRVTDSCQGHRQPQRSHRFSTLEPGLRHRARCQGEAQCIGIKTKKKKNSGPHGGTPS